MYSIKYSNQFKRALKLCRKRGLEIGLLTTTVRLLQETGVLPPEYRPHKLSGHYVGLWECHIKGDWILIWDQNDTELTMLFTDTGTHSDIF